MKTLGSNGCAILIGCVAFAACTNATPPQETRVVSSALGPRQTSSKVLRHVSATETVLYKFGSQQPDGERPIAGLTYVNGTMYGVTFAGLRTVRRPVLYSITPSGKYTILYRFTAKKAGYYLVGKLKDVGHNTFWHDDRWWDIRLRDGIRKHIEWRDNRPPQFSRALWGRI